MSIRIIPTQQEVKYKGKYISINKIKPMVVGFVKPDYLKEFAIHKKFNPLSGEIEYKYAWDSVLHKLKEDGILLLILESILAGEEEE